MKGNREPVQASKAKTTTTTATNSTELMARVCENYEYMRIADQSNQKKRSREKKKNIQQSIQVEEERKRNV